MFFCNYTKLVMLAFLYCFVVKNKIKSVKSLPPVGIDPGTVAPLVFALFPPELTSQVLIEGYSTSHVLVRLTFGLK